MTPRTFIFSLSILSVLALFTASSAIAGGGTATTTAAANSIPEHDITSPSGLPVPRFVALKKDEVRARFGPSFEYPVAYEFRRAGLPLKVIAEDRDNIWRRVEDRDGRRMWIHRSMLAPNVNAVVRVDSVVLRSAPRNNAAGRAKLTGGVMARIETCEDDWCRLKADKFRGWLPRAALWGAPL